MFGFMFAIGALELRILTIKKRKRRHEGRKDGRKQRKDGGWGLGQVLIPILPLPNCGHGWWLHLLELPLPRLSHGRTVLIPLHRAGCEDMMCRHAQSEGPLPRPPPLPSQTHSLGPVPGGDEAVTTALGTW